LREENTYLKTKNVLLPDATLSHMVKECKKLFSAVLCSKKRNQKSRLITIDKNVAILLTELFFYLVILAAASPWLRRSWSPNYSVLVKYENTIQHLYLPV
jgi:hypothetical protein